MSCSGKINSIQYHLILIVCMVFSLLPKEELQQAFYHKNLMSDRRTQLVLHILVIYNAFEFFPDQDFFFFKKKLECYYFKWLEIGGEKKGLRFLRRIYSVSLRCMPVILRWKKLILYALISYNTGKVYHCENTCRFCPGMFVK